MTQIKLNATLMELFGVFTLCYVGGNAVILNGSSIGKEDEKLINVSLAHGLIIAFLIFVGGPISGGQYNPAVTIPLIIFGEVEILQGILYILAQLIGSILAGLVLLGFQTPKIGKSFGYPQLNPDVDITAGFGYEFFATFFLVLAVFTGIRTGKTEYHIGTMVGLVVAADINSVGVFTGASMNPARTLGPALFDNDDEGFFRRGWWIYYAATILGGIVAAGFSQFLLHPKKTGGEKEKIEKKLDLSNSLNS